MRISQTEIERKRERESQIVNKNIAPATNNYTCKNDMSSVAHLQYGAVGYLTKNQLALAAYIVPRLSRQHIHTQ